MSNQQKKANFRSMKSLAFLQPLGVLAITLIFAGTESLATMMDPEAQHHVFEKAKAGAEVVAEVRAIAAVCTDVKDQKVNLQVVLQVISVDKGPIKKNDVVVVSRIVRLPEGLGPGSYGYWGETHAFPFEPGTKGEVALKWDKESRAYVELSGWVKESSHAEIPKEVGRVVSAAESK